MEASDLLLTLAEISIAFVGFSAVIVIFRQFASGEFSRFQHLQVAVLIRGGLLVLFLCVLPLLLELFPLPSVLAWRLASGVQALVIAAHLALYAAERTRSLTASPAPETSRTGYLVRMVSTGLVVVLQVLNAIVFPDSVVRPVYCTGVLWMLGVGGWLLLAAWRFWGRPGPREQ